MPSEGADKMRTWRDDTQGENMLNKQTKPKGESQLVLGLTNLELLYKSDGVLKIQSGILSLFLFSTSCHSSESWQFSLHVRPVFSNHLFITNDLGDLLKMMIGFFSWRISFLKPEVGPFILNKFPRAEGQSILGLKGMTEGLAKLTVTGLHQGTSSWNF